MVHLYLRIASAKYMLRYLSSRQSGESYERYMFIGFNTLSLNVCLVPKPQQHTGGNSCLEIPHHSVLLLLLLLLRLLLLNNQQYARAPIAIGSSVPARYLSVCLLSHQRLNNNNNNTTTTTARDCRST